MINIKLGELYGMENEKELLQSIEELKSAGMTDEEIQRVLDISEREDEKVSIKVPKQRSVPPIPNATREAAGLPPINSHVGNRDLQEIASELHKLNNNIGMLIKSIRTRK